jgi:hypothetical protein
MITFSLGELLITFLRERKMEEEKRKKWMELAKQREKFVRRMREILPPAEPPESVDWQKSNFQFLTKQETAELIRLVEEIRKVQEEMKKYY